MPEMFKDRQYKILILFGLVCVLLAGRAFQLQVLNNKYKIRADAVAVSKQTIYPARGLIYDRNRQLLINNTPVYDLKVIYNRIDPEMDTTKFCRLLGITRSSFRERLNKDFKSIHYKKHLPFTFLKKIPPEVYARFQESMYQFPGFYVQARNIRSYPVQHAAHALGYIREVRENEIGKDGYVLGDYIGAAGLERSYERELRGKKGCEYVLKDNLGRDVGRFANGARDTLPVSGLDLIASLDIEFQAYAEKLMQNKIGGIVAIEPATGEILAFVSSPAYDPGIMVIGQGRGKAYAEIQKDPHKPMFNRAIMAEYPPGSIFKPVVGLVGLQTGAINDHTAISCPGYYTNATNDVRKCRGHPYPYNVSIALQWSCNTYFFTTFRNIIDQYGYYEPERGLDTLLHYLHAFGLGQKMGVDFPGEHPGNVPGPDYYDRIYKNMRGGWKSPTIVSLGIGQGEVELTTLQMANMSAIIANRGYYYIPHFAKGFIKNDSLLQKPARFRQKHFVPIDAAHFAPIARGMELVVAGGTAPSAFLPGIPMAGKTGTVQNSRGKDHSTFVAFAPVNAPAIAIAVYVENAGGGGRFAAPIASLLVEKYIRGEIAPQRKWLEERVLNTNLTDDDLP
ncbi:MAG TPA: penicillin-binding protein 2 [Bacteroidetes bacterium]|nr:penicillin-binding protein 2 [Bacteroidota bacterium]